MNTNIRRLGIVFLAAFAIMVVNLTYWQAIDASNLQARPDNRRLSLEASHVRRGLIFGRNGTLLAGRTVGPGGTVQRYYTDPSLSSVIGYDSPRYGTSELEQSYDDYLSGQVAGTSWQTVLNRWEHKAIIGDNLTLTINDRLQRDVASLLPNVPSAAVVTDPRNGEVLAMVSKPSFDASQISNPSYWQSLLRDPNAPLINRVAGGYYPPGSTFKVLTISAALNSGIMSLGTGFSGVQATGPITVDGHVFPASANNLPAGVTSVSLEQALEFSDNIVFAQVGLALGATRFLNYTHAFGLDQPTPFDIPVSTSHARNPNESFNPPALASTAFGQGGLHLTPLQMNMIVEAIADGGNIPRPILVKSVTAPNGSTIYSAPYGTLYHPISAATASLVRDAMVQVVAHGSGFEAQIPGVEVAGKTGTAETGDGKPPHAWFVCFAPAQHPRVVVTVIVEHGGEGAFVAAPIAKQILEAALPLTR